MKGVLPPADHQVQHLSAAIVFRPERQADVICCQGLDLAGFCRSSNRGSAMAFDHINRPAVRSTVPIVHADMMSQVRWPPFDVYGGAPADKRGRRGGLRRGVARTVRGAAALREHRRLDVMELDSIRENSGGIYSSGRAM